MKIKELAKLIPDEISIYRMISYEEFENIYIGKFENIPKDILEMKIETIGSTDGRVDIQIK